MAVTKYLGPIVVVGQMPSVGGNPPTDYNPDGPAPSIGWGAMGFLDPRYPYQDVYTTQRAMGWVGGEILTINQIPSPSAINNIVASAAASAGTALTLTSSTTSSAVTKVSTAFTAWPAGNVIPVGAVVLDTLPGYDYNGTNNSAIQWYSPTSSITRAVRIASAGNDGAGHFLVSGWDLYGYPQTEYITGGSGATAAGKKAWKFIGSILPSGTISGSNVSVGTADIIGFPIRATDFGLVGIDVNSTAITAGTGWVTADVTSPATSVTGDVRGTYALQSAANGTIKVQVVQTIGGDMLNAGTIGMFGVTPA